MIPLFILDIGAIIFCLVGAATTIYQKHNIAVIVLFVIGFLISCGCLGIDLQTYNERPQSIQGPLVSEVR